MVLVLIGSEGQADFSVPLYLSPEKRQKMVGFLQNLLPGLGTLEVTEPPITMERGEYHMKHWTKEDYLELLKDLSSSELEKRLGRSPMSVGMRRGEFLPAYIEWLRRKGLLEKRYDLETQNVFVDEMMSQ